MASLCGRSHIETFSAPPAFLLQARMSTQLATKQVKLKLSTATTATTSGQRGQSSSHTGGQASVLESITSLDPGDYTWGTPTPDQLGKQFMNLAFLYCSSLSGPPGLFPSPPGPSPPFPTLPHPAACFPGGASGKLCTLPSAVEKCRRVRGHTPKLTAVMSLPSCSGLLPPGPVRLTWSTAKLHLPAGKHTSTI